MCGLSSRSQLADITCSLQPSDLNTTQVQVASYEPIAFPALHVWEVMRKIPGTMQGLAPTFVDPDGGSSGRFGSSHITLGARGDSYYEYDAPRKPQCDVCLLHASYSVMLVNSESLDLLQVHAKAVHYGR